MAMVVLEVYENKFDAPIDYWKIITVKYNGATTPHKVSNRFNYP